MTLRAHLSAWCRLCGPSQEGSISPGKKKKKIQIKQRTSPKQARPSRTGALSPLAARPSGPRLRALFSPRTSPQGLATTCFPFRLPQSADGGRASLIAYHLRLKFPSDEFSDVVRGGRPRDRQREKCRLRKFLRSPPSVCVAALALRAFWNRCLAAHTQTHARPTRGQVSSFEARAGRSPLASRRPAVCSSRGPRTPNATRAQRVTGEPLRVVVRPLPAFSPSSLLDDCFRTARHQ